MANFSPTSDKDQQAKTDSAIAALRRDVSAQTNAFRSQVSAAEFEHQTVTFNATSHADTEIKHNLRPRDPETVRYVVTGWELPSRPIESPFVYKDTSPQRRPWSAGTITLRCNIGGATARLLLFTEVIK